MGISFIRISQCILLTAIILLFSNMSFAFNQCASYFSKNLYQELYLEEYKNTESVQVDVMSSEAPDWFSKRNLKAFKKQGGDGYHATIRITSRMRFASLEDAQKYIKSKNKGTPKKFKYRIESFEDGVLTVIINTNGIIITELPKNYPAEIKARHKELLEKGVYTLAADENVPMGAFAAIWLSQFFNPQARGVIVVSPYLMSPTVLNHEMQHAYDVILKTNEFLQELPDLPKNVAELVEKSLNKESLSWMERMRVKSIKGFAFAMAESKASSQSVRKFFGIQGIRNFVRSGGDIAELCTALTEVLNYSFRNLGLTYHQIWIDPKNPRSLLFAFKTVASTYVFFKGSTIIMNGILYLVVTSVHIAS